MKKFIIPIFVILGFAFAIFWYFQQKSNPQSQTINDQASNVATVNLGAPATPNAGAPEKSQEQSEQTPLSPQLAKFLQTESALMNSTGIDPLAAENRARAQAQSMVERDFIAAKELALKMDGPANQKILSVYLLGLALPKSLAQLREFITAPLRAKQNPEPHTLDEIRYSQERAQRIMAIDAVAERARTSSEAKDALMRMAAETRDQSIREYIQKKIKEIS